VDVDVDVDVDVGADGGSGAAVFSTDGAGACSALDGCATRGAGDSALVAAVLGAAVVGLAVDDCVTGAWV
jgi:hypothetical protein